MAIERPKILSEITFPAAVTMKIYLSDTGEYDTAVSAQVPAGTYFMAADNQDDDLVMVLCGVLTTAMRAIGAPFASALVVGWIDSSHKLHLEFVGADAGSSTDNVKLAWSETTATLRTALGVGSSDETLTPAQWADYTAPHHHAYGWYADEDGYLDNMPLVDRVSAQVVQSRTLGGQVATQQMSALLYDSVLSLFAMTEAKAHSDGTAYGSDPPYPYQRNVAFECLWQEMIQGKRFRVYRNHDPDGSRRDFAVTYSSGGATTLTATTSTWATNQFAGMVFYGTHWTGTGVATAPVVARIVSNTADTLTFANEMINGAAAGETYGVSTALSSIIDGRYRTYVLDASAGQTWAPDEIPNINRFSVTLPLFRYEA